MYNWCERYMDELSLDKLGVVNDMRDVGIALGNVRLCSRKTVRSPRPADVYP